MRPPKTVSKIYVPLRAKLRTQKAIISAIPIFEMAECPKSPSKFEGVSPRSLSAVEAQGDGAVYIKH
jgi:hypothetical protein